MSIVNMGFKNKQAFALLKALKQDITGQSDEVANIGDYINVFQSIRDYFQDDSQFFSAVYDNIRMKIQPVAWNVSPAENPYGFIETNQDMIVGMKTEGYVFDRPIDEQDWEQTFFGLWGQDDGDYGRVDGDENHDYLPMDEDELNVLQWRKKDYPTTVLGTYGEAHFKDHITYYRHWILDSMTNPYEFYNMYSAIKSAWRENWKQYKSMWSMNTFLNMLTSTLCSSATSITGGTERYVDLLALYNAEFNKSLTVQNWKEPENLKDFAPWCYIKINEIISLFTRKTPMFAPTLTKAFRGKEYTWFYGCPRNQIATAFIDYPFKLMKSYSNAEVFNEKDLENPEIHYMQYWQMPDPDSRMDIRVGRYVVTDMEGNASLSPSTENSFSNILGIIYDKRSIGTSSYGEWEKDTGLNAETGHGNIHIHTTVSNYYNPFRKAVVLTLGNPFGSN